MPMNPNFLCCIGAELKNSTQQTTRMSQVYLYRAFEDDTLSDMLSAGFFNAAVGILRQDDLLLLYSPNETVAKWTYARVSNVDRDGVTVERIGLEAASVSVNTTGYSNISGDNLQEIINSIDAEFSKYVKKDGTSIMSAPLKFVAGSLRGGIGPTFGGVEFYTLNNDSPTYSLVALGRFSTNGFLPHNDNTYDIGSTARYWKDAYIARVITAVINNGYDIAVPVTNGPDTFALKSEVDTAANSGRMITDQGVWFAKMYAATVPPAADDGTNYADFSQTDGDGNPIIVIYERQSGAWVQSQTVTPPANYDGYVPVTKKIWDIVEQTGQNGGRILWNHQSKEFTPYPNIVSFEDIEVTGDSTVDMPLNPGTQQIVNKNYVDSAIAASAATKANVGMDNLTSTGQNIANWSSNVTNCITEIPQDINLVLSGGTLTLKAGSKVYKPNGAEVFDVITIANDISNSGNAMKAFAVTDGSSLLWTNYVASGGTAPENPHNGHIWYDTTNNLVKRYSTGSGTWVSGFSLPIALLNPNATSATTVTETQVFNGFGYVGSTIFALPGVKGLIAGGRKSDGSLYSSPFTVSRVLTGTLSGSYTNKDVRLRNDSIWTSSSSDIEYDAAKNLNYLTGARCYEMSCGKLSINSGQITYFSFKQAFHAVDYSDSEYIAHCAMPSEVYAILYSTLPVTNTKITAPADGYMCVAVRSGAAGQYISLSKGIESTQVAYTTNQTLTVSLPVSKGQEITLFHNITGSMVYFRFIYANGAVGQ